MPTSDYISLPIPLGPQIPSSAKSPTFTLPPLDGSLTITEIFDFHAEHSSRHPIFVHSDQQGNVREVLWPEAVRAMHRAGRIIRSQLDEKYLALGRPVVAVLAMADSITFTAVLMGIMRANCVPFPISPRNSPAAVAHLLQETGAMHLVVGAESSMHELAAASLALFTGVHPRVSDMPTHEELYCVAEDNSIFLPLSRPAMSDSAVILHSSGSTSFPKPIYWTQHGILQIAAQGFCADQPLTGMRFGYQALIMFHAMGWAALSWASAAGLTIAVFSPASPATLPTPETCMRGLRDTKCDVVSCVPTFIETWSHNPEDVETLKSLKCVITGGGPLNKGVGDSLTRQGVALALIYGSTELSSPIVLRTSGVTMDWEYFEISPRMRMIVEPNEQGNTELIIAPGPLFCPPVLNGKRGDLEVFETRDLLAPHPTRPGYWKVYGRSDDQIMHSTGEKASPLEAILNRDRHVTNSLMFGRGQFNAGILVEPAPGVSVDPHDPKQLEEFRNLIWPTVELMNDFAPQHSRVFKEMTNSAQKMIIVTSPEKPFQYTVKRTPRRSVVLNDYAKEIEKLYAAVDETTQSHIEPPTTWSESESLHYVNSVVGKVMKKHVGRSDDIFQHGCDSLQSAWIRNTLLRALKSTTPLNVRAVPPNLVYEHPSISALAAYTSRLVQSNDRVRPSIETPVDRMLAMAQKYSQSFPAHHPSVVAPKGEVVLVTGTTGCLGSALLAQLVVAKDISHIFAINRKSSSGASLAARQKAALQRQGLDASSVSSSKVTLLEADLSKPDFDLPSAVYELVTWKVDFKHALQSFEPQVKGLRHLIDLALRSPHTVPPRVLFTSSVGVFRHVKATERIKETSIGPEIAVGTGYSESKWASEHILEAAASQTPLVPTIIRVGQICGGSGGYWNEKEWLPTLVKSSISLRCLPASDLSVSWISAATTARVIAETRHSTALVTHLTHPRPVLWSSIFSAFSSALDLPVVPYAEWLRRLEECSSSIVGASADAEIAAHREVPALKLMDFFISAGASTEGVKNVEAMGLALLSLDEAKKASATMRDGKLPQVCQEDVEQWLDYWWGTGFLCT
ncbi:hypothetical protein HWV62_14586 [Athelia sp. TMB]|nr:hypothetical protein HWV62_14586 [Athelia sp. TMB]